MHVRAQLQTAQAARNMSTTILSLHSTSWLSSSGTLNIGDTFAEVFPAHAGKPSLKPSPLIGGFKSLQPSPLIGVFKSLCTKADEGVYKTLPAGGEFKNYKKKKRF